MNKNETRMNKKQTLFCAITGYDPIETNCSTEDDVYFEQCKTKEEKIAQLTAYQENFFEDYSLTDKDYEEIYNAIECEKDGSNDMYYAWESLEN